MIDVHSHILPGIDDGVRSFEEGVEVVRELSLHGVTDVIATPHFIRETEFTSSVSNNKRMVVELKERLDAENIGVNIYLGNEIYIDKDIIELIKSEQIMPLADSEYLLVELPLNDEYPNYADYLCSLMESGYKVILAHPERYVIFQGNYELLVELCEMGILLQCNIGSIGNKYGKAAKKLVKRLAKDKRIFVFGSDAHRPDGGWYLDLAYKKFLKYYDKNELEKILVNNPKKIIS